MSKINKEERLRRDGFEYFVSIYLDQSIRIPEIDEEIRRRKLTNKPIGLNKKAELEYINSVKEDILRVTLIMYIWILHNKLNFGEKRLTKAIEWFWEMADYFTGDYISYKDICETLKLETGLNIEFDWNIKNEDK